ncbi:biopolymer transporter ExbD [Algiphilus sp.]|uniref:ExbD/TolR family protein n=1 Tax=Algiphilus sp. TaxID=1872431 RepID=UPI001CA63B49|nr:biopolymer transporter ExbD [Algiphilus sp.]MBY8966783.1 biopolymer transporter ExbD [Algiphilus acroporae]MCI5061601.1 biopolymer transporter ExbD [Algiphilus sp.]MCI5104096.1 biopolymer transporter ExbD [Algiphilus sp.]MCR9090770.1 biopolymer transporter ExbD [Pseudomonadota bacterium]
MSRRTMSFRGKHLERRAGEQKRGGLNLVSLMDIFTILVFFLLVNSSAVEVLPAPRAMQLPESQTEERAREVPVIMITRERVLLQNGSRTTDIMSLQDAASQDGNLIPGLQAQLEQDVPLVSVEIDNQTKRTRGEINIMADKGTPFSTLKRIMATATEARFSTVSLAVLQRQPSREGS